MDDIRPFLFDRQTDTNWIRNTIKAPPHTLRLGDDVSKTLSKFDQSGTWQLPVLDTQDIFVGFLSKSSILAAYRQMIRDYS